MTLLELPTAVGDLVSRPGQMQVGPVLFGTDTPYLVQTVEGAGSPEVRDVDDLRGGQDGARQGDDLFDVRQLIVTVDVRDLPGTPLGSALDDLAAVWSTIRGRFTALAWWPHGNAAPRVLFGKPRRMSYEADGWRRDGLQREVRLEFVAGDAEWLDLTEQTVEVGLPNITGGRTYDRTYPLDYGGGSVGLVTVVNGGSVNAWPRTRINGPILAPTIANTTTGQAIRLTTSLAVGEFLEVDHRERTVLLGGTASRYGQLFGTPEWWPLVPGPNVLTLNAAQGNGAYAEVRWRDAYLTA